MKPIKAIAIAIAALISFSACAPVGPKVVAEDSVGVQMFMWNWNSVAAECTDFLGPAGYDWVLVSPPEEHILGDQWWTHYQPTSYKLDSNLGTREEFANMVSTCKTAGVAIIADAVINHMAASDVNGWAGTEHTKYDYPGLYGETDFHHCDSASGGIEDWNSVDQVQQCELLGLSDLDTSKQSVRDKIIGYLKDLRSLGVAGFRVDAAKHIAAAELKKIVDAMPSDTSWIFEVIGTTPDPADYKAMGNTFSFNWMSQSTQMFNSFGSLNGAADPTALTLFEDSANLVTMVSNHDTERNGEALNYRDAPAFALANAFMLSVPYGVPMVYSGYAFSENDASPNLGADNKVLDASCSKFASPVDAVTDGLFVCQHRWNEIAGMVAWRHAVGNTAVLKQFDDGNVYAFSRGELGFIAFNNGDKKYEGSVKTTLQPGVYCDLISGGFKSANGKCKGDAITVDADQNAIVNVASKSVVAISAAAQVR
ncbi:alpha-amylase family glycosyl hydrolase [Rhodoluna sp.]|uniref:alpha-amylase family glycosyl hydrolase n=1 Tax=Rhodoluna sp. TaxID=1969481 RepID=UPI0025CBDAB8|nr:alpha-amylase family glycosyl hydrolase [Rhodoluna sp.]